MLFESAAIHISIHSTLFLKHFSTLSLAVLELNSHSKFFSFFSTLQPSHHAKQCEIRAAFIELEDTDSLAKMDALARKQQLKIPFGRGVQCSKI